MGRRNISFMQEYNESIAGSSRIVNTSIPHNPDNARIYVSEITTRDSKGEIGTYEKHV